VAFQATAAKRLTEAGVAGRRSPAGMGDRRPRSLRADVREGAPSLKSIEAVVSTVSRLLIRGRQKRDSKEAGPRANSSCLERRDRGSDSPVVVRNSDEYRWMFERRREHRPNQDLFVADQNCCAFARNRSDRSCEQVCTGTL
jgi:hypothetical protein